MLSIIKVKKKKKSIVKASVKNKMSSIALVECNECSDFSTLAAYCTSCWPCSTAQYWLNATQILLLWFSIGRKCEEYLIQYLLPVSVVSSTKVSDELR